MKDSNKTSQLSEILNIRHKIKESTPTELTTEASPLATASSTPESATKPASWADNPKMRMLLAAGIVAVPVFFFISIYGSAFNLKTAIENSQEAPKEIAEKTVDLKTAVSDETDENLRGIIAIGEQYGAIAKIENAKPKEPASKIKLEAKDAEEVTVSSIPQTNTNPQPISQPRQPIARRNAVGSVVVRPKPTQIKTAPKAPQYDSMDDWYKLGSSGSYGSQAGDLQNQNSVLSISTCLNSPQAQLASNEQKSNSLNTEEENFLKLLDYREPPVEVKKNQVVIAQQVEGRLVTGINWVGGRQRVFVRLEEPLLDSQAQAQIPADSVLVYEVNSVNGGIVQGEVVSLIDAGEEIPLPKGAISVLDKKGKMLAAKFKELKHNGNSDVLNFALGAAKGTRDLIAQPDSSFSSISQFGQSQGTDYGDKNYSGTVLSGGATEILENRMRDAERRRSTSPISSFWQIEADTKIILQTNYSFKY